MVISGDMLFNPHAFDTALIQRFFKSKGVHASKHREAGASKLTHMLDRRRCVVLLPPGRRGEHPEPRHPRARPQHMPRAEVLRETCRARCLFPASVPKLPHHHSTQVEPIPHLYFDRCHAVSIGQRGLLSVQGCHAQLDRRLSQNTHLGNRAQHRFTDAVAGAPGMACGLD
jgi:hypothetical protein